MRIILPIDSRVADAAGVFFLDLARGETHFRRLETSGRSTRNGYRGGCLVGSRLYVCTSSEVHVLKVDWPARGEPALSLQQRIARPEWLLGERANADLHIVQYESKSNTLLVANSMMDAIDRLDLDGKLLERRYLWDMSDEIMALAYARKKRVADLCHLNHIGFVGQDPVLTLGNINGTRKGAIIHGVSGEFLVRDLSFPHDGHYDGAAFYALQTDTGRLSVFDNVYCASDLARSPVRQLDILSGSSDTEAIRGRIWVRGLARLGDRLIVGCSQFHDKSEKTVNPTPSHLRVFDKRTLQYCGSIFLPILEEAPMPVIYSILALKEEPSGRVLFHAFELPPPPFEEEVLIDSRIPIHARAIQAALAAQSNRTRTIHTSSEGSSEFVLRKLVKTGVGLDGPDSLENPTSNAMIVNAREPITVEYEAKVPKPKNLRATLRIHQYDDFRQISIIRLPLKSGHFSHTLPTDKTIRSIRLSLRLTGEGSLTLRRFRVLQKRPRSSDRGAPDSRDETTVA